MFFTFILFILSGTANARTYDGYRADYPKGAFCSAMGGACAADVDPENAYFQNPASLAASELGVAFDGDYNGSANLEPGMKAKNTVSESSYMGGISYSWKSFGIGFSVDGRTDVVQSQASLLDDQGKTQVLNLKDTSTRIELKIPIAVHIAQKWTFGFSLTGLVYSESISLSGNSSASVAKLDKNLSQAFSIGTIYSASNAWSFGSWFKTPLTYFENITIHTETFGNTLDYNEDIALRVPWVWSTGLRWSPGPRGRYLFFDLDLIGATQDGFLLTYDTFAGAVADRGLSRKGKTISIEPHLGFTSPWTSSSRGTYLLGSYYENGRTQGYSGRLHGTAGIAYDLKNWVQGLIGMDIASDFFQLLVTVR